MKTLRVKLVNGGIFKTSSDTDSGYDVSAVGYARVVNNQVMEEIVLEEGESFNVFPNETIKINTGVFLQLPTPKADEKDNRVLRMIEAQVRGRSGFSLKGGTNVKLGTLDNCYRGEIGVILVNDSNKPVKITKGDRIAQIVLNEVVKFKQSDILFVNELDESERGSNGFGSTGK